MKLDLRSVEMMLVGYEPGSKGYRLWNSTTRSVVLSHNVTFDKRSFPYKEIRSISITPSQPVVSEGPITIYYNTGSDGGPVPQAPTLPTMPAHNPTPEQEGTVFHTPLSQPAAQTPPQHPRPACIHRDPGVPPQSALPSPAFGPAHLPPSPRRLRENLHPNPRYTNLDNADRAPAQTRTCNRGISHVVLINEAAEYQDPLTFQEAMRLSFADDW